MGKNRINRVPRDLAARLFDKLYFVIPWIVFLVAFNRFVSWPIRNFLLVCWVYGSKGYYQDGIRVVSSKPTTKFSTGALAPQFPDLVTGFGSFIITVFGLTILLVYALRFYERCFMKSDEHAA